MNVRPKMTLAVYGVRYQLLPYGFSVAGHSRGPELDYEHAHEYEFHAFSDAYGGSVP